MFRSLDLQHEHLVQIVVALETLRIGGRAIHVGVHRLEQRVVETVDDFAERRPVRIGAGDAEAGALAEAVDDRARIHERASAAVRREQFAGHLPIRPGHFDAREGEIPGIQDRVDGVPAAESDEVAPRRAEQDGFAGPVPGKEFARGNGSGYVCEGDGGEGQNRTVDTTIFSRMLYQLSYLAPWVDRNWTVHSDWRASFRRRRSR